MSTQLFHMDVPHAEGKRASGILALLPHHAIDREDLKDRLRFCVYLDGTLEETVAEGLADLLGAMNWRFETLATRDWVSETQAGLPPVQAGRFLMYGSHDKDLDLVPSGSYGLQIDAATAFGTGHHGSTKGCLMMYSRLLKKTRPKRILDIGTGTGVLAIAAAKAQRTKVDATDFDPEAVRVTHFNSRLNGTDHLVRAWTSDGYDRVRGQYDLIFANILAKPLTRLAVDARKHLAPNAHLIMAGLQDWQKAQVINAYRLQGLALVDQLTLGRWTCLMMRKGSNLGETSHV